MTQSQWTTVDDYFGETLIGPDDALDRALANSNAAGLPDIQVTANQGKLLMLLAQIQGANRILEIGTLGGYSTIWLARALPAGGSLISLELDPKHAEVARQNLANAGLADRTQIRIGKAVDSMAAMIDAGEAPFDFIFIDADKPSIPAYLERSLKLSCPGTVIVVDNVVRGGGVADPESTDRNVIGVRAMIDQIAMNPELSATAIQTVGGKGYDGFAIIRIT